MQHYIVNVFLLASLRYQIGDSCHTYGEKYSRMDQIKFVEDSL